MHTRISLTKSRSPASMRCRTLSTMCMRMTYTIQRVSSWLASAGVNHWQGRRTHRPAYQQLAAELTCTALICMGGAEDMRSAAFSMASGGSGASTMPSRRAEPFSEGSNMQVALTRLTTSRLSMTSPALLTFMP